ncbi:MAG: hypothetical protein KKD31_06250 [Bacteroidetes bacterium]|nr:hypothetical protein [Bacteroidota bacterium]
MKPAAYSLFMTSSRSRSLIEVICIIIYHNITTPLCVPDDNHETFIPDCSETPTDLSFLQLAQINILQQAFKEQYAKKRR